MSMQKGAQLGHTKLMAEMCWNQFLKSQPWWKRAYWRLKIWRTKSVTISATFKPEVMEWSDAPDIKDDMTHFDNKQ